MQLRCGEDLEVGVLRAGGVEGIGQRNNEAVARGTSISAVDNTAGGLSVDLELRGKGLVGVDEFLIGGAVDKLGGISFPLLLKHFAHRVDDLDTVIRGRVVTCSNHDANGLAVELATTQASKQADAEADAGEQVSFHAKASCAILVNMASSDGVLGRRREHLFVHGCERWCYGTSYGRWMLNSRSKSWRGVWRGTKLPT